MQGMYGCALLASLQGGVAEHSIKCREASFESEDGVVYRYEAIQEYARKRRTSN